METLRVHNTFPSSEGGSLKAKPHKYGGEATDGAVDAWISLMKMYLEDHKGNENAKILTLLTLLHRYAQAWIMQETETERDTCDKVFVLLSKRFGIGASPSDARLRFDERKQQPNEKLDTFLDDLEALRIRAAPEEPLKTRNLEIMRKFMTGLLDHELHQSLLTSYTCKNYTANPPTVEDIRSKCHDYLTLRKINGGYRAAQKSASVTNQNTQQTPTTWVTPNTSSSNQTRAVTNIQQNVSAAQGQGQSKSSDAQQLQGNAPIDRSNWPCYSCGALGHIAR